MAWTSLNPGLIFHSPCRLTFTHRRAPPPRRKSMLAVRSSAASITDQLRLQLDQLHAEAEQARAKANNARSRLMRLSAAAEKLRRQAAVSVEVGKEDQARELLLQKWKVMQALEKSKSRIDLLDRLSAKLNEAITVKETQLIGTVTLDTEARNEDTSSPIRIVSLKEEFIEDLEETEACDSGAMESGQDHEQKLCVNDQEEENTREFLSMGSWKEDDIIKKLKSISSYEDFLQHLNKRLHVIEAELVTVLRLPSLTIESSEKQKGSKLQQLMEFLEAIRGLRERSSEQSVRQPVVLTRWLSNADISNQSMCNNQKDGF